MSIRHDEFKFSWNISSHIIDIRSLLHIMVSIYYVYPCTWELCERNCHWKREYECINMETTIKSIGIAHKGHNKINEIELKFKRHTKTTQIAVLLSTVVHYLIFQQLNVLMNYLLIKIIPIMTHFKQLYFNHTMKSFHGNGKINRDSNTDSYYTYY
eukprot:489332_1